MAAWRRCPAISLLAAVLAACASDEAALPACPNIIVVGDTAEVTKFQSGSGRDLIDVVMEAEVAGFDGFCEADIDEETASGDVEVELVLTFQASRGPANEDRAGRFEYFIVIADRNEAILAKRVFTSDVSFAAKVNRVDVREELVQRIPLKAGEIGSDYDIFVGFQLSAEELQYNRRKFGR